MKSLIISNTSVATSNSATMTSLEIAELTGKAHKHVLHNIRVMVDQLQTINSKSSNSGACSQWLPEGMETVLFTTGISKGRVNHYSLNRKLSDIVISGYSLKYRIAIIERWHELEAQATNKALMIEARYANKDSYKSMSTSLKVSRALSGKNTSGFHYANEAKLINNALTLPKKNDRDTLSVEMNNAIDSLSHLNQQFIEMGMTYQERKELITRRAITSGFQELPILPSDSVSLLESS